MTIDRSRESASRNRTVVAAGLVTIVLSIALADHALARFLEDRYRLGKTWMFIDRIFYLDPALVAGVIVVALKVIFGRSWPELAYERAGTDEFRWFAGEWTRQRGAFPSATACITTAVATSLWRRSSSMRWPPVVIAAVSTVLVVVQEYHWLSDAIAGVLLGVAIGRRTSRELS